MVGVAPMIKQSASPMVNVGLEEVVVMCEGFFIAHWLQRRTIGDQEVLRQVLASWQTKKACVGRLHEQALNDPQTTW